MADSASRRMAAKLYSSKIEIVTNEMKSLGEFYIRRYMPSEVLKVVNDYGNYFSQYNLIEFRSYKDGSILGSINLHVTIPLPAYGRSITLNEDEYNKLNLLNTKLKTLQVERDKFISNMRISLYSLRTENKVKECMPEALNFIDFPAANNLPVPVYTELRNLIKTIK